MQTFVLYGIVVLTTVMVCVCCARSQTEESSLLDGLSQVNRERLVLDDMEDVSDWYNGSPVETMIATSTDHVHQGNSALQFANLVDHTKGETNYPIGWPRTGKDMTKGKTTDWSGYDFFECWIYAETNRESLPSHPLGIGFYHSGHKHSTSIPLTQVRKDAWQRIVIPISELKDATDVRRVQFNISESNYKHGDRADFWIDDVVLTRLLHPVFAKVTVSRNILYTTDCEIVATYALIGYHGGTRMKTELMLGQNRSVHSVVAQAAKHGELQLHLNRPLAPGTYGAQLVLRDSTGNVVDTQRCPFRVVRGPF